MPSVNPALGEIGRGHYLRELMMVDGLRKLRYTDGLVLSVVSPSAIAAEQLLPLCVKMGIFS